MQCRDLPHMQAEHACSACMPYFLFVIPQQVFSCFPAYLFVLPSMPFCDSQHVFVCFPGMLFFVIPNMSFSDSQHVCLFMPCMDCNFCVMHLLLDEEEEIHMLWSVNKSDCFLHEASHTHWMQKHKGTRLLHCNCCMQCCPAAGWSVYATLACIECTAHVHHMCTTCAPHVACKRQLCAADDAARHQP